MNLDGINFPGKRQHLAGQNFKNATIWYLSETVLKPKDTEMLECFKILKNASRILAKIMLG